MLDSARNNGRIFFRGQSYLTWAPVDIVCCVPFLNIARREGMMVITIYGYADVYLLEGRADEHGYHSASASLFEGISNLTANMFPCWDVKERTCADRGLVRYGLIWPNIWSNCRSVSDILRKRASN